jgi:hypothetical protein
MSSPLDQDRVTQIEVSIVCMKRSVSTRYVPFILSNTFLEALKLHPFTKKIDTFEDALKPKNIKTALLLVPTNNVPC